MKKLNKKWIIAICCAVIVLAGGILAAMLLGQEEAPSHAQKVEYTSKLYWNVEREIYKTGKYSHQQVDEDVYRVLMAVDGKQEKVDVRGYDLVQKIDTIDVMGLEFDEEGIVTKVYNVEECTGGYAAKSYFVESVDGNTVVANNNAYFTGYSKKLQLSEETSVYDVSDSGPLCGIPTQVEFNDEIVAVEDADGNITHVFTKHYVFPDNVYWNVDKPYDSTNKISTRQPNALMQYEMDFILNGELVTYICRDPEVVNKIDGSRVCGLEFDENGNIIGHINVATATNGGRLGATNYYVSSLDYQNGKYGFRKNSAASPMDTIGSFYPNKDMVVYDMTGNDGPKGSITDVRLNDRIICVLDNREMITMIYVVARAADSPMYWNVDRDWNKTTQSTNRRPDANGWYYFKMAVKGKQVTVKTDDLAIANAIESPVNVGLKLNGDVVERVYSSSSVYPAGVFGSWYKITKIDPDGTITAEKTTNGVTTTKTGKVAEDCEYYNVSSVAAMEGEKTTFANLKVGDTIHSYRNFNGEIAIIYVVTSKSNSPIYWNVDKVQYWDATNEVSTRERAADGYYHILLAVNGKQVTLRTKDKKMVDDIDNRTCMGLTVSGSTIVKVFGATATVNTQGGLYASSWYVTAINGKTITATNSAGKSESRTMAYNCQVYDVSNTADMVGQVTTVKVGDQIRGLLNKGEQISVLYVLNTARHQNVHACDHCGKDVIWRAWDGTTYMADGGHYILNSDVVVTKGPNVLAGVTATLCLNGYTLTREGVRVLGDIKGTLNIVDCVGTGHIHGQINNNASVAMINGGTLNIYGGGYTAEEVLEAGKNGGIFTIIGGGQINMYDGLITGGKTTGYGGNINISDGSFNLYGGEITDGISGEGQYGGNIALSGENAQLIIHDGVISGGTSGSYGGNIGVAKNGSQLTIHGGEILGGTAATHGGNISVALGTMTIHGGSISGGTATNYGGNISTVNTSVIGIYDAQITDGQVMLRNNGGITLGGKLMISEMHLHNTQVTLSQDKPLADAQIYVSMTAPGVFAEGVETDLSACFLPFVPDDAVVYENQQLLLRSNRVHAHCDCGGVTEHTCDDTIQWIPLSEDTIMQDGGHYYLASDLSCRLNYEADATVYLCLNGYTLSYNARVFQDIAEGNTVNIYDCGTTGTVHGKTTINNASVVMVKGVLNIYGGTFTADAISEVNKNGGVVMAMSTGTINFYNGTITGGNTTGMGGCVYITQNAVFNMYGGTISNGTSAKDGGTLAITGDAAFTMTGGTITGGTAAGLGSCVYAGSTVPVTLGGSAQIQDIYFLNKAPIVLSADAPLDETQALIGITCELGGMIAEGITQQQAGAFQNNGKGNLYWEDDQLILDLPHSHCMCIGAEAAPEGHTCDDAIVWTAIDSTATINLTDGHYFLNWKGSNVAKSMKVADNATAYLCLNGSVIRAQTLVTLGENAHLIICDCSADQSGALESSKNSPIQIADGQQVTLYSGNISGTNHYNGGAVRNAASVNMTGGSFYMYGGQITEGYNASGNGGNVSMTGASQFYLYGGTITKGEAGKKGGNVALINANSRFYMYGGQITAGTAGTFGGNVSLNLGGQFVMDGQDALIADGISTSTDAAQGGGNIHIHHANGQFTLVNGAVTGGTAANNGGSVFLENGLLDVQGGSIGAGTASGLGNTVYVATNGTVTVAENASVADIYDVDAIEE